MALMPHYRNSTAAVNNYEVSHLNLFDVQITPPAAMAFWNSDLLMEQVIKIGGLDVDKVPPASITQTFKGWSRTYSAAKLEQTYLDLSFDFEVNLNNANSMYMYKGLKEWCNRIFNPLNGQMSLKKDYVGGPAIITIYNRVGEIYRQMTFNTIWPTSNISTMELDYNSSEIFRITGMTFRADYWNDVAR